MLRKGGHEISGGLQRKAKLLVWGSPPLPSFSTGDDEDEESLEASGVVPTLVLDLVTSLLSVWATAAARFLPYSVLRGGEPIRGLFYVALNFALGWLRLRTGGGSFNSLILLASSMPGGLSEFRPIFVARITAQVVGHGFGVGHVLRIFPEITRIPQPSVDINQGALAEGLLAFVWVVIYLVLMDSGSSFYTRILVSTVARLVLGSVGKELTGGWMNPANAFGWAFAQGTHMTMEHLYVYWFAPISGTLLAIMSFNKVMNAKQKND